jgi:undecaprenyl diphosphate synthase
MPDVDLLIRTGGESRLSDYLLWQNAYAELVFLQIAWPDFDKTAFFDALKWFDGRERRFGQTSAQLDVS